MKKKAVIVDDDKTTLIILEKFLLDLGFEVHTAEDGEAAYGLVISEKPDILITDMLLPKIHGVELCRKIKDDIELYKTKIILMTSVYLSEIHRSTDMACENDGFLKKPFDFKELKTVIQSL